MAKIPFHLVDWYSVDTVQYDSIVVYGDCWAWIGLVASRMVQGMDTHRTYGGWRKTEWASQIKKLKTQKKTEKKKMKREESVTDCFNDQSIKGGLHVWLRTWWLPMVTNGYQWLPMVADGSRVDVNYCFQEVQDSVIDFGTAINYKIKWNLLSAAGSLSLSLSVSLCLSLSLSISLINMQVCILLRVNFSIELLPIDWWPAGLTG